MNQSFSKIYSNSINNPEEFWGNVAEDIFWFKKPKKILNKSNPPFYRWYEDGTTNTCYNALDLHIDEGNGDKLALIYDKNFEEVLVFFTTQPSKLELYINDCP